MAIGVFKLSKSQRSTLAWAFIIFNIAEILMGVAMVILSLYIYISVAPIFFSERAEIGFVFVVIGLSGLNLIFNYAFGLRICQKCIRQSHKKSTRTLLLAWSCTSFYILFYMLLLAVMIRKVSKHIIRSMKHSLHIGMSKYLTNPLWKMTIDRLQIDLECCGVKTFKEWYEVQWLDTYQVNENSPQVKLLQEAGSLLLPVAPYSCCRITFPMQCFHDPLQQVQSTYLWTDQPNLVSESMNIKGCLEKLRVPIESAFVVFICLSVFHFILQIVIFFTSRILYTSYRNAVLLDNAEGISPGWIFGRGDCGYNRGKTLLEIMGDDYKPTAAEPSSARDSEELDRTEYFDAEHQQD